MYSKKLFILLLLSVGLISALNNITSYLYDNEKSATVVYSNFSLGSVNYSVVRVNGVDSLLVKNGEVILDQAEIDAAIHYFYLSTYYPNQSEIDGLKSMIKRFNDSRNDGFGTFKNKEEYECRDKVLLSTGQVTIAGKPAQCLDSKSCVQVANLLFGIYGEGLHLGSPTVFLPLLLNFTPLSLQMDSIIKTYNANLDNLNETNVVDAVENIKSTADTLKANSLKIESTIFRIPRSNDSADKNACKGVCWGICPSFDIDQDAADILKTQATVLSAKVAPLKNYATASSSLYTNTLGRLNNIKTNNAALYYSSAFKPINSTGAAIIALAESGLKHVSNPPLSQKLDSLKSLHKTIPEDVATKNFSSIDTDIADYKILTVEVNDLALLLHSEYNKTRDAKNLQNSLVLVLESKDLDPVSMKSLEGLENDTEELGLQFHDGLTLDQLSDLASKYQASSQKAQALLKSESDNPSTRVLQLFRSFARKVNGGIVKFIESNALLSKADIVSTPWPLLAFSSITFLIFASMSILFFLYLFSTVRMDIPKMTHIFTVAFVTSIMVILFMSSLLYLFLNKTSTDASFPEFLADLQTKNHSAIVVDLRSVPFADSEAMSSCGATLSNTLESKNKTWTIYTLTASSCSKKLMSGTTSTLNETECLNEALVSNSSFVLGYSPTNMPPKFSIVYQTKAEINSDLNYYDSCPIVALFN